MSDIIEGKNPVIEALKSGRSLNRILLARNIGRQPAVDEIMRLARDRHIPVEFVDKEAIGRISITAVHQGIVAYAAAKDYVSLNDLLEVSKKRNEPPLYCILDGLEDPQNLGAILRTADTSGFHGVIIRARREVGLTALVAKASSGAVEYVPVARVTNLSQAIEELKKNNIWVTGIDMEAKTVFSRVDYRPPSAIVIGGEGTGISDLVKKKCDYVASIPMRGKIASLNASVAAALVMYEVYRQRTPQSF